MTHVGKITICGGGNGAQTLLAVAAGNLGCAVDVYAPFADEATRLCIGIDAHGGMEAQRAIQAEGQPRRISADPGEVIPGSQLVMLILPAFAHESTLRQIAPFLDERAWVGAIPARGALTFARYGSSRNTGVEMWVSLACKRCPGHAASRSTARWCTL